MLLIRTGLAALLGTLVVASTGCLPGSGFGYVEVSAEAPPPPPPVEVVGIAPYAGAFYIQGHYYPQGRGYAWHPGNWVRGRPGQQYVQHKLDRGPNGRYRYRRGYWR